MWYMKFTKINAKVESHFKKIFKQNPIIAKIVTKIDQAGGKALLVGGAVRDLLMNVPLKDIDIEVHGLLLERLQKILGLFGPVSLVGKSFGVLRLHGLDADWSMPRKDSSGRHPKVVIDPNMTFADAFKRRDLTINAMGIDLFSKELIDPWKGYSDLKKGILRAPDAHLFTQDPLRLFRVMQFIGRFGMKPSAQLNKICAAMSLKDISVERIEGEFDKLLLRSSRPSLGIRWLRKIGRLKEILPELANTIGVKQNPSWHPEGDVFEHTMQALDAAAQLKYVDSAQKLTALYAILCHDLGKVNTTKKVKGEIVSYGHEETGVPLAKKMLKRITRRKDLIDAVAKLVRYHMAPGQFIANGAKQPAYKRLANKLAPDITMELLAKVALADKRGRNGQAHEPLTKNIPDIAAFLRDAKNAQVVYKPVEPLFLGLDLVDIVKPGPEMGKLLKKAYEIQIDEGIKDKKELLRRIVNK